MSLLKDAPRRIALTINTLTGGELTGGKHDVSHIFTILTNPQLGGCVPKDSKILLECGNHDEFRDFLIPVLEKWRIEDQLIFYFSGHGIIYRDIYCLKVGKSKSDVIPFENIMNYLKIYPVHRAILILDTCYSGKAVGIKNTDEVSSNIHLNMIHKKGIAILASCRCCEVSQELPDGSSSVFTHLLCEGIESGLGGKATDNGLINVGDIIAYINETLNSDKKYMAFDQRPVFKVIEAEGDIWIAQNRSRTTKKVQSPIMPSIVSFDELKFLYEKTLPDLHPCENATINDLNWELVKKYSDAISPDIFQNNSKEKIISILGFLSNIPHLGRHVLHKSAILCFCPHPERFYVQARSTFISGHPGDPEFIRIDVEGDLSTQIQKLIELTRRHLEKVQQFPMGVNFKVYIFYPHGYQYNEMQFHSRKPR